MMLHTFTCQWAVLVWSKVWIAPHFRLQAGMHAVEHVCQKCGDQVSGVDWQTLNAPLHVWGKKMIFDIPLTRHCQHALRGLACHHRHKGQKCKGGLCCTAPWHVGVIRLLTTLAVTMGIYTCKIGGATLTHIWQVWPVKAPNLAQLAMGVARASMHVHLGGKRQADL